MTDHNADVGCCPVCGVVDSCVDYPDERWFFCGRHRVRWRAAMAVVPPSLSDGSFHPYGMSLYEAYLPVNGIREALTPPNLPSPVAASLWRLVEQAWENETSRCQNNPESPAPPRSLAITTWWLLGLPWENAPKMEGGDAA